MGLLAFLMLALPALALAGLVIASAVWAIGQLARGRRRKAAAAVLIAIGAGAVLVIASGLFTMGAFERHMGDRGMGAGGQMIQR